MACSCPISCPSPAQLLKAWCVTVKVLPDIEKRYLLLVTAVKHGGYSSILHRFSTR